MNKKGRTLAIGDIHGGFKALLQCLERSNFDYENDELISLGDICDGWDEVRECVDELLKIKNLIKLRGNHDDWFREFIQFGFHPVNWEHGGKATFDSYLNKDMIEGEGKYLSVPQSHRDFFNSQDIYYIDDKNRMFVHGGWNTSDKVALVKSIHPWVFYWDRTLWTKALSCSNGTKLKTADNFEEIFIGHTSTLNWESKGTLKHLSTTDNVEPIKLPMNSGGVWNLDTGGGWNGRLTIMDVDTKEFWQSDDLLSLYSADKQRKS